MATVLALILLPQRRCAAARPKRDGGTATAAMSAPPARPDFEAVRLAVANLTETFGDRYPDGARFLARLDALRKAKNRPAAAVAREFRALQREALLANPLLDFDQLLLVKRKVQGRDRTFLGFPSNHECNSSLKRNGWDNEIAVLSPVRPDGNLRTFYRPTGGGYVGEVDLHWDAHRLLLTKSDRENWKIWEIRTDGTGLRQVSQTPKDVDCFDACYVPDGRIVFGSTASYQSVPCWHGKKWVSNLYVMNADGSGMRQLCFDQDHNFHPVVLNDGQVLYHRWDYTGISHIFLRQLMVMNPDGSGQRAVYGSNSWFPNSLYFPRPIPGHRDGLISILSGYHGVHRMGRLVVIDTGRGWQETDGIVHEIPRRGRPIRTAIRDNLVDQDWPKFLHPWPLGRDGRPETSGKYFLVACRPTAKHAWGIYLVDVFDNMVLVREEPGCALLEPVPLAARRKPPVLPSRMDTERTDGVVYLHNIYAGPGLAGVPRGTIKRLRVMAYHYGYRGLAGPDKIGYGGPWEVMRILGTVPVGEDGSAMFRVPALAPVAVHALDAEGKAVQLMRSWMTLMPGEEMSCVGCHERLSDAPTAQMALAMGRPPDDITPWHGPARGFDFAREVQPVLDAYCVRCHNGAEKGRPDLRPADKVPGYKGRRISGLGVARMHPAMKKATGGVLEYTPAYEALIPYVRRVGIEDDVSLLVPGEYHADTSPLIQMLRKRHSGVRLDAEAWDRLVTWIDLNAPCHGTWGDVYPVPDGAHQRRMELRKRYGGPTEDPEKVADLPRPTFDTSGSLGSASEMLAAYAEPAEGWPFGAEEARRRQDEAGRQREVTVDLGGGVTMRLVRIPAGEFVFGSLNGEPDETMCRRVQMRNPFWMGAREVTNRQFRRFDPDFSPGYYTKRHGRQDDKGLPLDGPDQPAVRVSWTQALGFCRWLSERAGREFTLPTETQWEWACGAGSASAFYFGDVTADYSKYANVGDASFSRGLLKGGKQVTGGLEHLVIEGAATADTRFNDGAVVTCPVGRYRPNAWGLFDMHGNAAEWTRTAYRVARLPSQWYGASHGPYERDDPDAEGEKVVRGGSFFDPPKRCRSAFRLAYPAWQRVFNVGFRVVCEADGGRVAAAGE